MKQFFQEDFFEFFCKEVLILKIKKRTLFSFLLKNIFFFEKHKLVSTIEVLYKIIFGWKKWVQVSPLVSWVQGSGFRFRVQVQVQGVCCGCKYFFIRGWVGFLFWFFEIFEFLFFLMVVRVVVNLFASLLLLDIHRRKDCCWDTHLEYPSRRIFIII